jgi:hypothetical protein
MFSDSYRCRPCGHKFTLELKDFWVGPLPPRVDGHLDPALIEDFTARHTQTFHCSQCTVELTIPSLLLRPDWLYWRTRFESDYSRYPFLRSLVSRIDSSFIDQPWSVAIGSIPCPYCTTPLAAGSLQPSCTRCHSDDVEHINQWHSQTRDLWPPVI